MPRDTNTTPMTVADLRLFAIVFDKLSKSLTELANLYEQRPAIKPEIYRYWSLKEASRHAKNSLESVSDAIDLINSGAIDNAIQLSQKQEIDALHNNFGKAVKKAPPKRKRGTG